MSVITITAIAVVAVVIVAVVIKKVFEEIENKDTLAVFDIKPSEMKPVLAFVNGAVRHGFVGKNTYVKMSTGYFTKEKLEKLGCQVKIRSARH